MTKRALITGITGQDGAYLAHMLLSKGYEVYGGRRHSSTRNTWRLEELGVLDAVQFVQLDMLEMTNLLRALEQVKPDEVYNLAAHSFVPVSFEQPILTTEIDAVGVARLLEAVRTVCPAAHFYQAGTSEMFGLARESPQSETTPFHPRSPYGVAKTYAHYMVQNYREAHGLHASNGILFNHESPLRGEEFISRKITLGAAAIALGRADTLRLGNLEARRDWGYAGDYVQAMWLMLQQEQPGDFVIGTGTSHAVRDLCRIAFGHLGLNYEDHVTSDASLRRPAEVDALRADPSKAHRVLGWQANVGFGELVAMMVDADRARLK